MGVIEEPHGGPLWGPLGALLLIPHVIYWAMHFANILLVHEKSYSLRGRDQEES